MIKFISGAFGVSATLLPVFAAAATLNDTMDFAITFLNGAIGLFITLAIVVFFWGLVKYLTVAGDKKAEGLSIMFYGVITIFVMVSIWGIIGLLQNTFKVGGNPGIQPPSGLPPGGLQQPLPSPTGPR